LYFLKQRSNIIGTTGLQLAVMFWVETSKVGYLKLVGLKRL